MALPENQYLSFNVGDLKIFLFFLNIDKQLLAFFSEVLWVMITIVAFLFFLSGVWIILFTEILYLANLFVIRERTPCLSLTSNLRY